MMIICGTYVYIIMSMCAYTDVCSCCQLLYDGHDTSLACFVTVM